VIAFNPPNGHVADVPPPSFTVRATGTIGAGELSQHASATCQVRMPGVGMTVQGSTASANVPAGGNIQVYVPTIASNGASDPVPDWTVASDARALTKVGALGASTYALGAANQTSTLRTTTKDGRTLSVQVKTVAP